MKKTTVILFILFTSINLSAQKWEHFYGNPGYNESIREVIETYDKGYLISGSYELLNSTWLFKTDINGNILWEKYLKWTNVNLGRSYLTQDLDGNILSVSGTSGESIGIWPIIVKLDSCGNKEWCRLFIDEDYNFGTFDDVLVLENGDILALGYLDSEEDIERIFLYYIHKNGDLIWRQGYASQQNYPHIRNCNGSDIHKYDNRYLIDGYCFYPYPSDTTNFYRRPIFIMLDSLFNEQWVLPFGVNDSIIGRATETLQLNDSIYLGVGLRNLNGGVEHALLMYFNNEGQELGYVEINNDSIGSNITQNYINNIEKINDSLFIALTAFGVDDTDFPWGELIIDSTGKIYKKEIRNPNTNGSGSLIKTFDNKYVIGTGLIEGKTDWDIYMYKINEELEHDTIYPGNYTYDSLCPYQIQSGEIDISDCLIITDVGEVPSPKEYYSGLQSIPIKAFPNPVKESQITFSYLNTEHHQNMELRCFDVFGNLIHTEKVYQFQGESKVFVDNWRQGMYIALIYSNNKVVGQTKFIVR